MCYLGARVVVGDPAGDIPRTYCGSHGRLLGRIDRGFGVVRVVEFLRQARWKLLILKDHSPVKVREKDAKQSSVKSTACLIEWAVGCEVDIIFMSWTIHTNLRPNDEALLRLRIHGPQRAKT